MTTLLAICFYIALYVTPTIIAYARHHNVSGVAIVNIALGWTIIGWFAAFIMACGSKPQPPAIMIDRVDSNR
jgi:hypothetical protein